jgi:hypothetical protein
MKGLGQVVVRARVEAGDLLAPGAPRREDQHGRRAAVPTPTLQHAHAVHLGQTEVQDHRVIGFGLAQELGFFAIGRMVDGVTRVIKGRLELTGQIRIVFDQQDPHLFPIRAEDRAAFRVNDVVDPPTIGGGPPHAVNRSAVLIFQAHVELPPRRPSTQLFQNPTQRMCRPRRTASRASSCCWRQPAPRELGDIAVNRNGLRMGPAAAGAGAALRRARMMAIRRIVES